ncbi:tetratricopeptide repeat protein [Hyalangium sp.]|uniref:tetratricopeptide repeat protein n=1 Tax=Hyalangium sp. TaxID=2028555 RepID=UPI002D5FDF6C|nr:tetratricopeptide repeat protein [Hyalangium sp.]HYI00077.1 tetratricopeptide repeat protein [Hyalangium sp.]
MTVVVLCCSAGAVAGEDRPDARLQEAQQASNEALALYEAGKYSEAIAKAEHSFVLREAALGGTHLEVATSLNNLAFLYTEQGLYDRAEPLYQRALAIREAALGKNHPSVAASLNNLALLYAEQGLYDRAEPLYQRALAIQEAALGKNHRSVATSLNNLASLYKDQGLYGRAEPLYQRVLAIDEATLGKNHPDVATSLNNLAGLYFDQGLYGRAEPLYQRALAIWEAALGKNHPDVARVLNNLASLYKDQGLYGRAEPLYQRALAIWEAALGKNHPDVATSLNNLASLYTEQGLYGRAEPLFQRALTIIEAALGKNHPFVATSLNNLASLYRKQGLYGRAEPLFQRALAIREATLGKDHPHVATSLNELASLYYDQGLYGQAELLYQRALAIREAALGKDHPDVATSLNDLALLYAAQGSYDRAEPLYQRARAILEAALGKNHLEVATSLNNLAGLYADQSLYGRAEPLYQRALAIQEETLGKGHPTVAALLNNLASLYYDQGLYGRAESLFERALAIREAVLGKNHPEVATSLNNLASLYKSQGFYGRAEPLYQRTLAIQEAALGKNHPEVGLLLNNLASLRLAQHRLGAAIPLLTRSFAISEQRLRQEALGFSEARMASFLQLLRTNEERLYALLRAHPDDARVRRLALGAALLLKGRSVEEMANISRAVYRSLGAEEHDTFERLRGLRTQLAKLSLQGPGALPLTTYKQQLKELAEQGDALDADLAKRSAPLRALAALPSPADIVDRVAAALPKDGAVVEFITYEDSPRVPKHGTRASRRSRQLRYLALVLLPDATIRARDLGPAEPIDSAAARLRDALANRDASFQPQAQALYQLAFRPLLSLLGKTHRLFLSPDGQLALVPFAALHDGHQFLVDTFDFTYLTSGKDLLPRLEETAPASSVIVLADPDFGASLPAPAPSRGDASARAERSSAIERFFSSLREDPVHRAWALTPLPGTRQEAKAIQRLLPQAQLFLGPEATKERLLHLPTPGILHLATHGFFLGDVPAPTDSRAVAHFGALGEEPLASRPPDPLLRSGLLLAGSSAPAPDASSPTQPPPESTLATALELASLNLWGTQLVVLSACDTGRGEVKLGQGVYGLRRAFVVAGAETVVMSLWKVNDETTRQLMEDYYRNLLAGQGRATALREAMRELRALQPHPHYWAPFIVVGSDAPLRTPAPNPQEPPKWWQQAVSKNAEVVPNDLGSTDGPVTPDVANVVEKSQGTFQGCVETELRRNPSFRGGRVLLVATVATSGIVKSTKLDRKDLDTSPVGKCIKKTAMQMVFPAFKEEVAVEIPLILSSGTM